MKKAFSVLFFLLLALFSFGQDFPERSSTLVTDYTNTLSADQKRQLESKLVAFNDSTTIQIAMVIMKSVGEYDINNYAFELGRKWGVGGKEKNTGVVVLVALGDRKVSIQTGYGMEGVLPDIYTQRIIQDDIKPRFKEGDYYGGLDAAANSIISASKGEYKSAAPAKSTRKKSKDIGGSVFIVLIIIVGIIIAIKRGGGGGGGHQVIGSRGVSDALFWGLLLGSSGRGGGGGGGFGGGFGGGGGGFGGFGGGSFGGGGSSGSW